MSASQAYSMLLKPAVFQPLGLFSFGLIGYIWIDKKLNAMNASVNEAIQKVNATNIGVTDGNLSNDFTTRLNELEKQLNTAQTSNNFTKRLTELEKQASIGASRSSSITSTGDSSSAGLMTEINQIKAMTDLNMFDIQSNFDALKDEINQIKTTSDENIGDIAIDLNMLKRNMNNIQITSDENMTEIANELEALKSNNQPIDDGIYARLDGLQEQIELIQQTSDENMSEIAGKLKPVKVGNDNTVNNLEKQIQLIQQTSDENIYEIAGKLEQYENNAKEHYDALMVAENAFNSLEERQKDGTYGIEQEIANLMEQHSKVIGRLKNVEETVDEHRNAFSIAENALNDLLSWKNEGAFR